MLYEPHQKDSLLFHIDKNKIHTLGISNLIPAPYNTRFILKLQSLIASGLKHRRKKKVAENQNHSCNNILFFKVTG